MNFLQKLDKKALEELNALNSEVLKLLEGISYNTDPSVVNDLVIKAFGDVGYSKKMQDIIMCKSVEAATIALGENFAITSVDQYIAFELAKTYEGVTLSSLMRDTVVKTQQEMTAIIKTQLDIGTTWKKLSSEIQNIDKVSDVAKIITDMGALAKQSNLPKEVQQEIVKEIRRAQVYIKSLSPGNAPTKQLKISYEKVVQAALNNDVAALKMALERAAREKIVYNADRIARTEIATAYNNAFMTQIDEDDDITGFQWLLSDDHPVVDECDIYANVDNGAGPGVYRKGDFPSLPAHQNCLCSLVPVVIDVPKKTSQATLVKFLDKQTDTNRAKMIGVTASKRKSLYMEGLEKHGINIKDSSDKLPAALIKKT